MGLSVGACDGAQLPSPTEPAGRLESRVVTGPPLALGTPKPTFLEKWPTKPLGAGPASEGPPACAFLCVSVPTHTPAFSFLSPGGGAEAENILEPPSQQHSHPTPCAGLG